MKRREFLTCLAGAAIWPSRAAIAEPAKTSAKVGFLGANSPATASHLASAFATRLLELGWISEGRNVSIEYRWAAGQTANYRQSAAELIAAGVDVIVTTGNAPAITLRQLTSSVPIVMAASADILETGLVMSLARPGGNVTGLTFAPDDFVGKNRAAQGDGPGIASGRRSFQPGRRQNGAWSASREAPVLGITLDEFEFRSIGDLDRIAEYSKRRAIDALFVRSDPLVFTNRHAINAFAIRERLPTVHRLREYAEDGGLMSYGPDFAAFFRRAADYVDKILRGQKPDELPMEQPTLFHLVINLKTARDRSNHPAAGAVARR